MQQVERIISPAGYSANIYSLSPSGIDNEEFLIEFFTPQCYLGKKYDFLAHSREYAQSIAKKVIYSLPALESGFSFPAPRSLSSLS